MSEFGNIHEHSTCRIEDAPPRFASEHPVHDDLNETSQESLVASLATCKTFIELDEDCSDFDVGYVLNRLDIYYISDNMLMMLTDCGLVHVF